MIVDIHSLIDHFITLNDNGESMQTNPEYFSAGFQLLIAASPYGGDHYERRLIVSALLFSHPNWFDHQVNPADYF